MDGLGISNTQNYSILLQLILDPLGPLLCYAATDLVPDARPDVLPLVLLLLVLVPPLLLSLLYRILPHLLLLDQISL